MRTFVFIDAEDYFGCDDPSGLIIHTKKPGISGILEAVQKSDIWCEGQEWDNFWKEIQENETTLNLQPKKAKLQYIKDNYLNGDGESCKYLFEQKGDKLVLILG